MLNSDVKSIRKKFMRRFCDATREIEQLKGFIIDPVPGSESRVVIKPSFSRGDHTIVITKQASVSPLMLERSLLGLEGPIDDALSANVVMIDTHPNMVEVINTITNKTMKFEGYTISEYMNFCNFSGVTPAIDSEDASNLFSRFRMIVYPQALECIKDIVHEYTAKSL